MTAEFAEDAFYPGRHRSEDHDTSIQGAQSIAYRAGTQKALLLQEYIDAYPAGLTSEEAAGRAGLIKPSCCYWKRVSEMEQAGILWTTQETRKGLAGVDRIVYELNPGYLSS